MSAGPLTTWTLQNFLKETELNLLECKVCFEKYSHQQQHRPKNLLCGHVMCQDCVSSLARPQHFKLECPFCRKFCKSSETSDCLPVLHLSDIFNNMVSSVSGPETAGESAGSVAGLASAGLKLKGTFGGWGRLINPTGVAFCARAELVAVVHDGKQRVSLFTPRGELVKQFGPNVDSGIRYPLDVAVALNGCLIITDAGDRAVKVFSSDGRNIMIVRDTFCLPWGVSINSQNQAVVTDSEAGKLVLLEVDFHKGKLKQLRTLCPNLCHPRGVAVSQSSGHVAVVEHLRNKEKKCSGTRLKVFNSQMQLISQVDTFGFSLMFHVQLRASAVAFDKEDNVIVADAGNKMVVSLGTLARFPSFTPIITYGLLYPVGLALMGLNSVIVLDSGNHSVNIFDFL
ncbi:E3 ubiquitin-protein ligase NHLRC1 [Latimeria chalumnae]|uniref:RING-type E3 ubiquitin transferase n=1 Tax=Latimeria chalumnae TaxID=7897 RepID=H3A889_LATCH|nr:PREDICTED: E3 ubiquitin-protein ligase NHLRC1 [Latimeria chalumnae]|eukprot:XP_006011441.1 PREDICTED: E3 ubiquitin-protein ligase NHLRC1 [Latimeria chalumnae]